MNIPQNLQMKLTFLVFTLLVAVVISGAASAGLEAPEQSYPSAYVVENGYSFTGYASIQDAADNYETMDGNHIELETGIHEEQVVVNKNLTFTGMGANPEDTVIQAYSDNGGTVTIATGMSVVLENLSIWNYGTGPAIINNGQLTIINCIVNGTYVANEVTGTAAGVTETLEETIIIPEGTTTTPEGTTTTPEGTTTTPEGTTTTPEGTTTTPEDTTTIPEDTITPEGTATETTGIMLVANEDGTTDTDTTRTTEITAGTAVLMGETSTGTTTTEPTTTTGSTTDNAAGTTNPTTDPGIPLASLASGMLMVMGGTVVSGRKHH